jgi:hypothetical protein
MKIELEEHEIKEAVIDYISTPGFKFEGNIGEIDLKNARGEFGVTATISIVKNTPETSTISEVPKLTVDVDQEEGDEKEDPAPKVDGATSIFN